MANTKPSSSFLGITDTVAMNTVAQGSVSNAATLEFTGLTYQYHILKLWDFLPASASILRLSLSYDNGATWASDSNHYYTIRYDKTNGGYDSASLAAATEINLTPNTDAISSGSTLNLIMSMEFDRIADAATKNRYGFTSGAFEPAGYAPVSFNGAWMNSTGSLGDCDGIRLRMSTGNISRCNYKLFGFDNS
jgi:hypothetical protein